ncbi:hypothetical protein ACFQZO_09940 [Bradyrhizobium sp. GCM10027634]|uniref:hypothetical protein n=1 Tax=unclassified Bradyrhizobium TaxID=2631580 RepID=UPI00263B8020|nr:hypothetical protein [Bradyrhizobium sp. WYCCWR 12677]MDN5001202.1 hypothetical protein [Bradyrhizobium sp. WYCCWR 12677]
MYALFEGQRQIGNPFATEKEVWEAALIEGLVTDVPVAEEEGGHLLPAGYHVQEVDDVSRPTDATTSSGMSRAADGGGR